ncbi:helix-turn-helix domain-containing protein [Faecalibaculum rodentium]|uniref:helix-turn-helix domain-containing protein n=1 Tax=Faecalibaculum rodentium TaxID=1702221 RepID=UPI00256EDF11|nr:XRE family transcriptional regulator [Faecalibaculum rodentium]
MLEDTGRRIKELRTEKGWTLEQLGDAVGVNKSTVRKWETGMIKNMRRDKLAMIAKALSTTPAYLMGWQEEGAGDPKREPGNMLPPERLQIHLNTVPVYDPISCGTGKWVDEQPVDYLGVPDTMVSKACHYFANPAFGDSMEPRIQNGDYVVFEQTSTIDPGSIGAFSLNGEYFCKRFKKLPDGSMWLFSENPLYDPIPIQRDDDFRVLGKFRMRMTEY